MSVCLVDTTVLCNIVPVPGRDQDGAAVTREFRGYIERGVNFILPMATIIETGNHVARNGDGRERRTAAKRFVALVKDAIDGNSPFSPMRFFEPEELRLWLDKFPDSAMSETGFGDLSIIEEFNKQRELNPRREVFIWSLDSHLQSYRQQG